MHPPTIATMRLVAALTLRTRRTNGPTIGTTNHTRQAVLHVFAQAFVHREFRRASADGQTDEHEHGLEVGGDDLGVGL